MKYLIVDDNRELAELFAQLLKTWGLDEPFFAGDGRMGMLTLDHHPDISLVFTDWEMPNMNGLEFIKECRRVYPGVRIVFMSGRMEQVVQPTGADATLPKPFLPFQLKEVLQKVKAI